jgi:hypothetical protein
MTLIQFSFTALLLLLAVHTDAASIESLPSPTGEKTSLSRVITDTDGTVHLSWVQSAGKTSSLYRSKLNGNDWTRAELIAEGDDWFVNWADFPFLSVQPSGMAAHWLKKSSGGTYDYDVVATFFNSATRRWSKPAIIHKDGVSAEHGFVSMLSLENGSTLISWLDGRNTRPDTSSKMSHSDSQPMDHGRGGMTLRAGIFDVDGQTETEWELDDLVCDCCQTSSAMTASGPVVVYRNRTENEIRDTYITRLIEGQWSEPLVVYADNWQIAGCPVNGPSVASNQGVTAVAWFTAQDDIPRVKLALSTDDGKTFNKPLIVADNATVGRISSAVLASGDVVVSWLKSDGADAEIILARYSQNGTLIEKLGIAKTKSSRRSGFPVITSQGNDVYITWTEVFDEPQVKVSRVRFLSNAQK